MVWDRNKSKPPAPRRPSRWARLLPRGIRERLFLLISLALLPMLALQAWDGYRQHVTRERQTLQTEVEVAQGVATNFATYIDGVRRQLDTVGQALVSLSPYTPAEAEQLLTSVAAQAPALRSVSWVSPEGTILASSLPQGVGRSVAARPYFQQIAAGRSWAMADIVEHGIIMNAPALALGVAARDSTGALQGVAVASFEPTRLDEMAFSHRRYAGGMYVIFDARGRMVFHSPPASLTWSQRQAFQSDPLVHQALEGDTAQGQINSITIGARCFAAFVPIPMIGWVAGAARPMQVVLAPLRHALFWDSMLVVAAVLLAFLLASLLAQTISQPLRRLERDARTAGEGRIEAFTDSQAPAEVGSLRHTLTQMIAALTDRAEALRRSEGQYRRLFEANLAGVYVTKLDGTILDFNNAMMTMLGYDAREEVLQHRSTDFYANPAARAGIIQTLQKDGIITNKEIILRRKDDTLVHTLGHALLLTNEDTGEPYIQGAAIDITARRQAEDALRELTATLETQVARRTKQLEMRTRQLQRLTVELSETEDKERRRLAEILHDDLQQVIAAAKFHLSLLNHRVQHDRAQHALVAQVDQLLTEAVEMSRDLSHEISPPVLYRGRLAEALTWLAEQVQAKHGLAVRVEVRDAADPQSGAARTFLYKAARELLFNVVKHAGVREARLRLRRAGAFLCLVVCDRGRGFNPQEVKETTRFGLLNLRERSEALGGRMRIRSAEGHGSTFFIAVPEGENLEMEKGRTGETATLTPSTVPPFTDS